MSALFPNPPRTAEDDRRFRHAMAVMGAAPPVPPVIPTGPQPIFFAPLLSSLVPATAGDPSFTFTRATTAYATGMAPGGNASDGQTLIACAINEARFQGARRIGAGNWSPQYADASLIPLANLLGYVAENAATNLCVQSQAFDHASWNKANATINPDFIAAPDGTLTADAFLDNAANAIHEVNASAGITGLTNGGTYTLSLYAKAGTLTWMQMFLYDTTNTLTWANFNLQTGVVGNKGTGATASIVALANGWCRCSVTVTVANTQATPYIYSIDSNQNVPGPAYVGIGQTMYLWGAQVEQASDPSSYIPTTTAAVTRNVDDLRYPVASNISPSLASAYAESYPTTAVVGYQGVVMFNNIDAPLGYPVAPPNVLQTSTSGGGAAANTANTRTLNAVNKNIAAWGGATSSVCLNGGAVGTGPQIPSGSAVTVLPGGISPYCINGSIRNVKFYATRLTDVELQALTT